jgi:hypothetical protein
MKDSRARLMDSEKGNLRVRLSLDMTHDTLQIGTKFVIPFSS